MILVGCMIKDFELLHRGGFWAFLRNASIFRAFERLLLLAYMAVLFSAVWASKRQRCEVMNTRKRHAIFSPWGAVDASAFIVMCGVMTR